MSGWQRLSVAAMGAWTIFTVGFVLSVCRGNCQLEDLRDPVTTAIVLAIWLMPPLLVFLLQWVIRWIYRGFRDH